MLPVSCLAAISSRRHRIGYDGRKGLQSRGRDVIKSRSMSFWTYVGFPAASVFPQVIHDVERSANGLITIEAEIQHLLSQPMASADIFVVWRSSMGRVVPAQDRSRMKNVERLVL